MGKNKEFTTASPPEKRQKSTTNEVVDNDDSNSLASDLVSLPDSAVTAANNTSSVAAPANTATLPATATTNNDALDADLDELVNENSSISQHLNLPLSTNHVAINVNNYGNNLSTVFFFGQIIDGPGCYTIKEWIKKMVPVNNTYCACDFEFVWPNDVAACLRGNL